MGKIFYFKPMHPAIWRWIFRLFWDCNLFEILKDILPQLFDWPTREISELIGKDLVEICWFVALRRRRKSSRKRCRTIREDADYWGAIPASLARPFSSGNFGGKMELKVVPLLSSKVSACPSWSRNSPERWPGRSSIASRSKCGDWPYPF